MELEFLHWILIKIQIKMPEKTRYTDNELVEFGNILFDKIHDAKTQLFVMNNPTNEADEIFSKEEKAHLIQRQEKFIQNLQNARIRIDNKTYGICRATGKLISKERLRAVPHATLAINDPSEPKKEFIDKPKVKIKPLTNSNINLKTTTMESTHEKKSELKNVKLSEITVQDQVRTIFDEDPLTDLTASVKKDGVLQAIGLRIVNKKIVVIYGERRYRASMNVFKQDKTRDSIPARIFENITDNEALQLQITENLQRKDLHPMEEAIAFKKMIDINKIDIIEIAIRLSRSPKYVGTRLKLNDLIEEFQKAFYGDRMNMGDALEVCKLSKEAQKEMYKSNFNNKSPFDVEQHHINKYQKDLKKAPFDTKDAGLIKAVGACIVCPHNTASNTLLFPDEAGKAICMDGKCFSEKCDISFKIKLKQAIEDPQTILINNNGYGNDLVEKLQKKGEKIYQRNSYQEVEKPSQKDIDSGKVLKAFVVYGSNEGATGYVTIKKATASTATKGSAAFKEKLSEGKATASDINDEIKRIEEGEERKKEIDHEKAWPKMYELLLDNKKFQDNTDELSIMEKASFALMLLGNIGWQFDSEELFKNNGFKGNESEDMEVFNWLIANKKIDQFINNLSRAFLYAKTPSALCRNIIEENADKLSLKNIIAFYDPKGLKEINDSIDADRAKRSERNKVAIDKLKAQLKPKADKKK